LQFKETGLSEAAAGQRERLARAPLVLTTSGSTGVPKLVPLSGSGVERFFEWATGSFEITSAVSVLSYAPLNFDLSLLDIWTTLFAGGCAVLVDHERATDADYLTELLAAHPVEVIQAVPLFFRLLAERGGRFPSVRHVIATGDMLPPSLLARFPELFPNARAYNVYGCTETNDSLIHEFTAFDLPAAARLPVGRPIEGVFTELVDRDGQVVVGEGIGELLVSTPFQADGYLDEELTAERFVTRSSGGETWICYRTGDVVRRDGSGLLFLEGRDDFQVKVRGVRTNLQEIEHVLEQHPDVVEASVVALPDELAGCRLHAALRTGGGRRLNSLQLRSHCSAALPRTAIPSSFDIRAEPLPRTSTGKIDRHLIRAQHQSVSHQLTGE
jgi:acyl-coenzyme A synthetase/AMP-(fatty) acid ligase